MKIYYKYYIALMLVAIGFSDSINAQSHNEEVIVQLSNPSNRGTLDIRNHDGTITIEGYNGNEVVVQVSSPEDNDSNDGKSNKRGLKKISMHSISVDIYEEENHVTIDGGKNRTDFIIKVPKNFDLLARAHHNGDIKIENVSGQMEIISHHGSIRLNDVSGSLVADTHHGEIKANFLSISDNPMAFSTYHGDVDISFPVGTSFNGKLKSEKGDIYTDFEVEMNPLSSKTKSTGTKMKNIKIGGWMTGKFGNGGQEYLFNTYHGDIIIQKS